MNLAMLFFPLMVNATRAEFEEVFRRELDAGSMVISAWVHMRHGKTSMFTVTLAAKNSESLRQYMARVKDWNPSHEVWELVVDCASSRTQLVRAKPGIPSFRCSMTVYRILDFPD
jgi:hypothetical protein